MRGEKKMSQKRLPIHKLPKDQLIDYCLQLEHRINYIEKKFANMKKVIDDWYEYMERKDREKADE